MTVRNCLTAANANWTCQNYMLDAGDNFYPCGADSLESGLNRFQSDWAAIYQTPNTPNIAGLKWYHVVGNHDYGFNTSVDLQLQYAELDDRWAALFAAVLACGCLLCSDVCLFMQKNVDIKQSTSWHRAGLCAQRGAQIFVVYSSISIMIYTCKQCRSSN